MVPWFATGSGTCAEVVVVDAGWLAPLPDGLDDVTAATLPLNGLTARQGLDLLGLPAGATLLVTGASGPVGGFAVQLAVAAGFEVLAVASAGDEEWVSWLGAKHVIARDGLLDAVRELAPGGVDGVLDAAAAGPELIGAVRDGGAFTGVTDPATPAACAAKWC